MFHFIKITLIFGSIIMVLAFSGEFLLQQRYMWTHEAPGNEIELQDGTVLHANKEGLPDGPIIVFENGSGMTSSSWDKVTRKLHDDATVITYDRAGYGWSGAAKAKRTPDNIVNELNELLIRLDVDRPVILVGHSLGGMYARLFAEKYPERVEQLVLIDARPETFSQQTDAIFKSADVDPLRTGSPSKEVLSLMKASGLVRLMQDKVLTGIPEEYRPEVLNVDYRKKFFYAKEEELDYLYEMNESLNSQKFDIPIHIFAHTEKSKLQEIGLSAEQELMIEQAWQQGQEKLKELSSQSVFRLVPNAGHIIQQDNPKFLVRELQAILMEKQ